MESYESLILGRQEDIYGGLMCLDDEITIGGWDHITQSYVTRKTLRGESAQAYMYKHGIW